MKINKYKTVLSIITVIIFFIPFFWLKPGEMDLGGDSSRLYFYDPINYLLNQSLYSVSQAALGGENLSFYGIPFFLFLALFKLILGSSTLLITVFQGASLAVEFLFSCLIVKELLGKDIEQPLRTRFAYGAASISAGLYYTFSPVPINDWAYVIMTHNQVFLNPLIFYLLLRFFVTAKMRYMLFALLISVIFAANFDFAGAPGFFSFYPIVILFLFFYTKFVRKCSVPFRGLIISVVLFLLMHAFHLFPQMLSLFTSSTGIIHDTVFSNNAKFDRGLGYFTAVAPTIKVTTNLLGLPQNTQIENLWWGFIIFPLIITIGFFLSTISLSNATESKKYQTWLSKKTLTLIGACLLITLFFDSANITNIGLELYKKAFNIPGFSMFRNFQGQWHHAYAFFYTLTFGLSFANLLKRVKFRYGYVFITIVLLLLLGSSWLFINGTLTDTINWQSKNIKTRIVMDPDYEKFLSYVRSLPIDGKILTFPTADYGYQVLKGANEAAYEGPSTITYLTGKKEFIGYGEFDMFGDILLQSSKSRDYRQLQNLMTVLNIKYIFHNADPYIYEENFPERPYSMIKTFMPEDQNKYKTFIENLNVSKKNDFGKKYNLYEVNSSDYVPRIFASKDTMYVAGSHTIEDTLLIPLSIAKNDNRFSIFTDTQSLIKTKNMFNNIFSLTSINSENRILTDKDSLQISSTIPKQFYSVIYPFVIASQKKNIGNKNESTEYLFNKQIIDLLQAKTSTVFYDSLLENGKYNIYVQKDKLAPKISIQNADIQLSANQIGDKWLSFDYVNTHQSFAAPIILSMPTGSIPSNVEKWRTYFSSQTTAVNFVLDGLILNVVSDLIKQYSHWNSDSLYLISFDFLDKQDGKGEPRWKTYRSVVETGKDIQPVFMKVLLDSNDPWSITNFFGANTMDIKNFSVIHFFYPKVVIKKDISQNTKSIPKVIFTRVNPTKYIIKVNGATQPYTLTFLDKFQNNWKLFLTDSDQRKNSISASYFSGDIKETVHNNTFLDGNVFETWGKKLVAQDKHYMANGYANAWYIEPKDTNGAKDYTLILEHTTQTLFYISLFVSVVVVFFSSLWLIISYVRHFMYMWR